MCACALDNVDGLPPLSALTPPPAARSSAILAMRRGRGPWLQARRGRGGRGRGPWLQAEEEERRRRGRGPWLQAKEGERGEGEGRRGKGRGEGDGGKGEEEEGERAEGGRGGLSSREGTAGLQSWETLSKNG